MSGVLEGKSAIVTGSAQSIGRGIALALAQEGAHVVVADLNATGSEETVNIIEERGGKAHAIRMDVTDPAAISECVKEAAAVFGGVNILVNNAIASQVDTALVDTTDEMLQSALDVGVVASFRFMRAAHPFLKGNGRVINLRSGSELAGIEGMTAYVATKSAIAGLTRVAAKEWGRDGITVNAIMPLSYGAAAQEWFESHPKVAEAVLKKQAIQRQGNAESDIGRVAVFLAGPDSAFVTGCTINVDGGATFLS